MDYFCSLYTGIMPKNRVNADPVNRRTLYGLALVGSAIKSAPFSGASYAGRLPPKCFE